MLATILKLEPVVDNAGRFSNRNSVNENSFGLLTSIGKNSKSATFVSDLLNRFNSSSNNLGQYMRFIIVDSSYKEGIDLRDVKYVHLFEELDSFAQTKQAVARAIRFCSHTGLPFKPNHGWTVHVHLYKLVFPNTSFNLLDPATGDYTVAVTPHNYETYKSVDGHIKRLTLGTFELYKSNMVDFIEAVAPALSIDYLLTKNLRTDVDAYLLNAQPELKEWTKRIFTVMDTPVAALVNAHEVCSSKPARHFLGTVANEVYAKFGHLRVEKPSNEKSNCLDEKQLTKFQQFLGEYVVNPMHNGLLLWHNPGSGKTCRQHD